MAETIIKCKCKWSLQANCPDSAADGTPNETQNSTKMSHCWAKIGSCSYQVKVKS